MTRGTHRAKRHVQFAAAARWRQSWTLVLRLAVRDARSHRGRSILIMIMVFAPVLLIGSAVTWLSTDEISARELVPSTLGRTEAKLIPVGSGRVEQLPDPAQFVNHDDEPGLRFGDHQPGEEWTADQLAALTGGTVFGVDYPTLVRTDGDRAARVPVLAIDAAQLPDSGLARLVSGRWPAAEDEIAVTESGVAAGLPTGGSVMVRGRSEEADHPVSVVGVVTATNPDRRPVFAVVDDAVRAWIPQGSGPASGFLLERAEPVTWAEVQAWNAYGLLVFSAAVALDPPPAGEQSAQLRQQARGDSAAVVGLMALSGIGLLLETTLLAGPAFAVSAARQRRSLALIASNGAERAQLRRYVLGQALLLGGLAALLGVPLGLAGGAALIGLERRIEPSASVGPFDPPWIGLGGLVLVAVLSSVVAALLPARGAAKIKIADLLAGRERSQPVRARMPLLAGLLMLGAAGMLRPWSWYWPDCR